MNELNNKIMELETRIKILENNVIKKKKQKKIFNIVIFILTIISLIGLYILLSKAYGKINELL